MRVPEGPTSHRFTLESLREAILQAGLEIYRAEAAQLHIAQRVRMHLMDSHVSVVIAPSLRVCVTVRAQRSDFPSVPSPTLFERVRAAMQDAVEAHGYVESNAQAREILNPGDTSDILDVWHELTFERPVDDVQTMLVELQWALARPKCIDP